MLKDLLKKSRSYRSFDSSVKISEAQLANWIDCARYCPSSINMQALKFRPVTAESECDALLATTRWAGKLKELKLPPQGHEPVAYVVVCIDEEICKNTEIFLKDVGICAQTIMLAACEAGFGGCMIGSYSADALREILGFPSHLQPKLVLALGKPDEVVALADLPEDGDTSYYRKNGVHYVPKRPLDDIIVK